MIKRNFFFIYRLNQRYLPSALKVLMVVIATDKSKFAPRKAHQTFDAPPAGETPVKKIPNCISTESGNSHNPKR